MFTHTDVILLIYHLVYLNICIKQTCENLSSTGRRSLQENNGRKNAFAEQDVCFEMLEFETSADGS